MNYLTKEEALEALNNGCHVSHDSFYPDEYLYRDKDGVVKEETGREMNFDFFEPRSGIKWDTGWFIINKSH